MKNYSIESTQTTPSIKFDPTLGMLEIKGRSIPENSVEFYLPLFAVLDEYVAKPRKKIDVNIQLEYYNSSSSVCILNVLKKLEALHKLGTPVNISWLYEEEDEDTLNAGKNFQEIIHIPFTMIKVVE